MTSWQSLFHPVSSSFEPMTSQTQLQAKQASYSAFSDILDWKTESEDVDFYSRHLPVKENPTTFQQKEQDSKNEKEGEYEVQVGWKVEPTEESKAYQDYSQRYALLVAEMSSASAKLPETKPYSFQDFQQAAQMTDQLRRAKSKLSYQMTKGASIDQVSLSSIPAVVKQRMELEEKEEDEAQIATLRQALILENETSSPESFKYRGVVIHPSTDLKTLQSVSQYLGIKDFMRLRSSQLVESISATLKASGRFWGNNPEVSDLYNLPIYTKQQVETKWKDYQKKKTETKQKKGLLPKTKTKKTTLKQILPNGQTVLVSQEEEHEGPEDDSDLRFSLGIDGEIGLPWFAASAGGKSYNQSLDQAKESMLKILIDNYFVKQPDISIIGDVDPINAILPTQQINYEEKIKEIDLLFGKMTEDDPKHMDEILARLLRKTEGEIKMEGRYSFPDVRNWPRERKTDVAWKVAARASPKLGDFALMEHLISTIPHDVDLNSVNEKGNSLLMHTISEGKFLDLDDPNSDSNPLRMVALILAASIKYGPKIQLSTVNLAGNNIGLLLMYKCQEMHILAAQFRKKYSQQAIMDREAKEQEERMKQDMGLSGRFGLFSSPIPASTTKSSASASSTDMLSFPDSSATGGMVRIPRILSPEVVNNKISIASQMIHALTVTLFRPEVIISHYNQFSPFSFLFPTAAKSLLKPSPAFGSAGVCSKENIIQPLDPNFTNKGITMGGLCAQNNCYLCLHYIQLYAPSVDFTIREDATGLTAFDYAVRIDNPILIYEIMKKRVNFFNKNIRGENVFHHAARHRWNQCYLRHPGQKDIMNKFFNLDGKEPKFKNADGTTSRAPSVLEMLWEGFSKFVDGYVKIEVNEKAREFLYKNSTHTPKGKPGEQEEERTDPKLYGSSDISFLSEKAPTKGRFSSIYDNEDKKKELNKWQEERRRELVSAVLDSLSKDLVTPLWISGLIRDAESFSFLLSKHADPTIKNMPTAQGINLYEALVDLLPEEVDEARSRDRQKIILDLGVAVNEIAATRRIKESEMRQATMTFEEQQRIEELKMTTVSTGPKEWTPEEPISDYRDELKKFIEEAWKIPTVKGNLKRWLNDYLQESACSINQELTTQERRQRFASRKASASILGFENIEAKISQIESESTDPRICMELANWFRQQWPELSLNYDVDKTFRELGGKYR